MSCFRLFLPVTHYALLITILACAPAKYDIQQGKMAKFFVVASWYGPEFHGRPTASGETFDMHAMTCAHKEYPPFNGGHRIKF